MQDSTVALMSFAKWSLIALASLWSANC